MRELKRKTEENPRTRRANAIFYQWIFARGDYNNFLISFWQKLTDECNKQSNYGLKLSSSLNIINDFYC